MVVLSGCPERIDVGTDTGAIDTGAIDGGETDGGTPDSGSADTGCAPQCIQGVDCGSDDGCGGACLGRCPNDFEMVCHGGICNERSWCPQAKCDLWESVGCFQDESCYLSLDRMGQIDDISCESPGALLDGDACSAQTDCSAGHGCLLGKCRRYCCRPFGMAFVESSECGSGRWCELFYDRIGYCESLCDMLRATTCAPDQICVVSAEFSGVTYCIESRANASGEGGSCAFANDCTRGLYCHQNTCMSVCDLNGSTTCTGTCTPPFSGAGFGVCPSD